MYYNYNDGWEKNPTLTIPEMKQQFEDMAKIAAVPVPTVEFPVTDCEDDFEYGFMGRTIFGQFYPPTNSIFIYPKGHWAENCKHEFIHYIRYQMKLGPVIEKLMNSGHSLEMISTMKEYEEERVRELVKKDWPFILANLEKENQVMGSFLRSFK